MTISEFSNEFDILYNNIMSNAAPGIDEYEKSVFLTKAQYEIVKNYFEPKGNKYQEGFDGSSKRQMDFSTIVLSVEPIIYTDLNYVKFDDRSVVYSLPSDIMFIISETIKATITTTNGVVNRQLSVVPIHYDAYSAFMSKPYKLPCKNQAWRVMQVGYDKTTKVAEILTLQNGLLNYKLRYVKRPTPIVLVDLELQGLSIEGENSITECILDPLIHGEILQRAVELAKAAYIGDIKSTVELGQRSE